MTLRMLVSYPSFWYNYFKNVSDRRTPVNYDFERKNQESESEFEVGASSGTIYLKNVLFLLGRLCDLCRHSNRMETLQALQETS